MAKKAAKTDVSGRRPVQWDDLTRQGQQIVAGNVRQAGTNAPAIVSAAQGRAEARVATSTPGSASHKTAEKEAGVYADIAPHVQSKPVTMASAAEGRTDQYHAANQRNADQQSPDGAGWYFNHHTDIAAAAKEHGFETHTAITASAVMSPRNRPDNEKAAVTGLMKAHTFGAVHVTPQLASHFADNGVPVDANHLGKTVPIASLHRHALAAMSDTKIRDSLDTNVPDALEGVSRGGSKRQVRDATDVLVGHTPASVAIDPHRKPKVAAYAQNIHDAVPNTGEHVEYMARVQKHHQIESGQMHPEQQSLDLYGMHGKTQGMLSPTRNTAEDTWQNAMTYGQPNITAGDKGRTHVAKTVGSMQGMYPPGTKTAMVDGKKVSAHPDASVGVAALHHAFNNKATQGAADNLSYHTTPAMAEHRSAPTAKNPNGVLFPAVASQRVRSENPLPVVAAQEVPWTEVRRSAGKAPEYKKAAADQQTVATPSMWPKPSWIAPETNSEVPGQQALFGRHVRGPRSAPQTSAPAAVKSSRQFSGIAGHEHELTQKDYAAENAIGRNRQAKQSASRIEGMRGEMQSQLSAHLTSMKSHPVHGMIGPSHPKFAEAN